MRYLLLLLLFTLAAWAEGPELRIFQLNNRPAAATVEMVRQVLNPTGTVLAEERLNKLVVKDTPDALQRVADLLQQIDQPAPQVRITVDFAGGGPASGYNAGVAAGTAGPNNAVGVRGNASVYNTNNAVSASQNLLVMSGEKGRIMVGRDLVSVQPYWSYANGLGLLPQGLLFQTVSTGFAVEPLVIGDNIRLKVIPWISYQSPNGPGQLEFAESATTLNVRNGDSVMLSAGTQTRTASSSGVAGTGTGVYSQNRKPLNAFGLILGGEGYSETGGMAISLTARIQPDYK